VELVGKAVDAASMFWQSLDQRERMMLAYAGAWVLVALLGRARQTGREQLKRELLEELAADGGART
jgi:type II secretory pathway component PulM